MTAGLLSPKGLCWITAKGGASVADAIVAGSGADGAEMHVARAADVDTLTPGKLHIGYKGALIPFCEEEHFHAEYEVLANPGGVSITWAAAANGMVPPGAVKAGHCIKQQPTFVARVYRDDEVIPCKLVPRCNVAFAGYDGKELEYAEYEVLCVDTVEPQSGPALPDVVPPEPVNVKQDNGCLIT